MSNLVASMYIYKITTSLLCLVIGGRTSSEDDEAYSVPSYMLPQRTSLDSTQKKTNISGRSQSMVSQVFSLLFFDILDFNCTSFSEQVV
jgi:hypothetical protein